MRYVDGIKWCKVWKKKKLKAGKQKHSSEPTESGEENFFSDIFFFREAQQIKGK